MRKSTLLLLVACCLFQWLQAQPAKHVILISIDGFRPEFYKDPSWSMVNIGLMKNEGVYSDGVRGVFPTVTYPSHTTMVTGVMPLKHGIYYNTPFEPSGATGRWYWEYDSIKTPTLWSVLRSQQMKTACVGWPVTVGAPIDYNLPEIWAWPNGGDHQRLEATSRHAYPAGLFEEVQQNATGKLEGNDFNLDYLSGDENSARIAGYLIRKYKPAFLAVHLANVDHFEHEEGRDGDKVRQAVASVDRAVKTILESLQKAGIKDSTAVIVTGDHGFVDIHTSISPNIWLAKAGLITDPAKGNWRAQFHTAGGSAFLHLKNSNDEQALAIVKKILDTIPQAQKKLFRIVDRKELDLIGADPRASMALAPIQGITFSASQKGDILKPVKGGTHGFFPDCKEIQTGFVGYGAGFKKGAILPLMGLEDIAPLIAHLLGVSLPSAEGVLYPGILQPVK